MQQLPSSEEMVWKVLTNVHTSLPGIITEYDSKSLLATVKPGLMRKYRSEEEASPLPTLYDVPLLLPRFGKAFIKPPKKEVIGSHVLLVFCERSIDSFLKSGAVSDPKSSRKFSLSDAVAIFGLSPEPSPISPNGEGESLEISYGKSFIEITEDGRFKISNGTQELISILSDLIDTLSSATTMTSIGAQPFILTTQTRLGLIKNSLEMLKG